MKSGPTLSVETMYSFQQVARLWQISAVQARKIFRDRDGIVNIGNATKPSFRIPASLVMQVMIERGYNRDAAERVLRGAA